MSRSCGAAQRRTTRSWFGDRKAGYSSRGGSFHNAAPFRCLKCRDGGRRRDMPLVSTKAEGLGRGSMGERQGSRERRASQFARSFD